MPNKFFAPGEHRAEKVNELFTAIAPRYDLINDLQSLGLHRYWKRRLIQLARVQPGERALDVCCGTGDLALALARRGAQTVGLDFNDEMLRIAEAKAGKSVEWRTEVRGQRAETELGAEDASRITHRASSRLRFVRGDAQQIPFPDNSFDIVTIGYGLRNLASWEIGLREMQRVARPGGRLLVLEFGKPDNPLWRSLYFAYLRLFVPVFGRLFCGDAGAYAYILESLKHYPAQHDVAAKMRELGQINVRLIHLLGGVMSINYGSKSSSSPSSPS